jgi:predicted DNA-binding transcriptional regulator AlpA
MKTYLTAKQLRARWGNCSHMFIERRLQRDPAFPRPRKLGGSSIRLWDIEEIESYERAAVARSASR